MTTGDATPAPGRLLVAALVLTGLTMRTAVTSIGAVLDDLQHGLHVGRRRRPGDDAARAVLRRLVRSHHGWPARSASTGC